MKLAPLLFVCAAIGSGSTLAQESGRSPLTSHLRSVLSLLEAPPQAERSAPSHPLIIRVHEKALVSQSGDQVNTTLPVSCVVLGTPATGTSWTRGVVRVDTSSAKNAADFLVTFRGQSFSRTVGVNGPARIHSHSVTDFVVSRHVTFSPLKGFQSSRTSISAQTRLKLDDVRATKPGLRGALVRRIGWRRASESQRAAEREVSGHVRQQLLASFDARLDKQVADLNRQLQTARYAQVLFGNSEQLDVRVCSAENCVQIAVGASDARGSETIFPSAPVASPLEVWLHDASVQEQSERLAGPLALLSAGAKTIPALQTISMAAWQSATPKGLNVRSEGGWVILSFDSSATSATPPESRLARRSAN